MSFTQPSYSLKNLVATMIDGKTLNLISLNVKRNPIYAIKEPGQSLVPSQVFMGENLPDITVEFYADEQAVFSTIEPNTPLDSFTLNSPNDADAEYLGALLDRFPANKMCFGGPDTTLDGKNNSTIKVPIMCNVLNPGTDGGFPT